MHGALAITSATKLRRRYGTASSLRGAALCKADAVWCLLCLHRQFCHLNGVKLIARSHQLVMEGYKYHFPDKNVVTVCRVLGLLVGVPFACSSPP